MTKLQSDEVPRTFQSRAKIMNLMFPGLKEQDEYRLETKESHISEVSVRSSGVIKCSCCSSTCHIKRTATEHVGQCCNIKGKVYTVYTSIQLYNN